MIPTERLEDLIHQLDRSAIPDVRNVSAKVVMLDSGSGKILQKKPVFGLGRGILYYLVQSRMKVECKGPTYAIKSFKMNGRLDLEISYEARCIEGSEEANVAALCRGGGPSSVLHARIAEWVDEFYQEKKGQGVDVCLDFYELRCSLEEFINAKANERLRLALDTSIEIRNGERIRPIPLKTSEFAVRVSDCDEELRLILETQFEVDEERKTLALLTGHDGASLEAMVTRLVQTWLAANANLNDFSQDLSGGIRQDLIREINNKLESEGWFITFLTLASSMARKQRQELPTRGQTPTRTEQPRQSPPPVPREAPPTQAPPLVQPPPPPLPHLEPPAMPVETSRVSGDVEEFFATEYDVDCYIQDTDEEITVRHRLILHLEDLRKLHQSRVDRLEDWVRAKLDQITRTVFFDKRYIDVLFGKGPEEVRGEMKFEALKIGYRLQQMTVVPDLEPLKWKDGLNVEVAKREFETKDTSVKVSLDIIVDGKIADLGHDALTRYLSPSAGNIREALKEAISRETQKCLHGIDPRRFYMYFHNSDNAEVEPVCEILEAAIKETLSKRFAFEDANVILRPQETDLSQRLRALQEKGPYPLKVDVMPMREAGERENVEFEVYFDVLRVHEAGWDAFRIKSMNFEEADEHLAAITSLLEADIRSNLANVPADLLQFSDFKIQKELVNMMNLSIERIKESFGVTIKFLNMRREATDSELAIRDEVKGGIDIRRKATAAHNDATIDEYEKLLKQKRRLLDAGIGPNNDELQELIRRLKEVEPDVESYWKSGPPSSLRRPHDAEGFSFEEFHQLSKVRDQRAIEADSQDDTDATPTPAAEQASD